MHKYIHIYIHTYQVHTFIHTYLYSSVTINIIKCWMCQLPGIRCFTRKRAVNYDHLRGADRYISLIFMFMDESIVVTSSLTTSARWGIEKERRDFLWCREPSTRCNIPVQQYDHTRYRHVVLLRHRAASLYRKYRIEMKCNWLLSHVWRPSHPRLFSGYFVPLWFCYLNAACDHQKIFTY